MTASAAFLLALGLVTTFAPQELLAYADSPPQPSLILILQTTGALYLGFAILNWTARYSLIGGIYSRPVALGNLLHFFAVSMALLKAVTSDRLHAGRHQAIAPTFALLSIALLYVVFAAWFGLVVFGSPYALDRLQAAPPAKAQQPAATAPEPHGPYIPANSSVPTTTSCATSPAANV